MSGVETDEVEGGDGGGRLEVEASLDIDSVRFFLDGGTVDEGRANVSRGGREVTVEVERERTHITRPGKTASTTTCLDAVPTSKSFITTSLQTLSH